MPVAVELKGTMSAAEFRAAAGASKDANQARRLLALAAIRDGMKRDDAARMGGMDRQTLPDWVHAFNEHGLDGLINAKSPGRRPKLSPEHKAAIRELVLEGPDPVTDGLVRWRRIDLANIVKQRFDVCVDEDTIGRVLRDLGFSHISARPQNPDQADDTVTSFQKRFQRD
jgi:transposase